ncbi:MAG TPA: transcriptional repressor LexA [Acidiphilium sp.]|nr:MAG: repressor LexA [Acidiphilium sp. 21-60-14]OYV91204.1 MAG: repressor LexA [Acidiphilium sp. 37-60-79]OZB39855.1 MAG: repressor LexA [Acidiphilium sp. 34-60-192]HQT87090.1 transcriptional repressor LexA [Acidiphilium sp.]HQU24511.1 transcriptional repressor LexA [Acidiphilium sp.]
MLTRKQHDLLEFIDQHLRQTGCSPSFEEMKDAIGLKSKSGIHRLISALEERGFLRRHRHRARALEVVRLPADAVPQSRPIEVEPITRPTPPRFAPNVIRGDFSTRFTGAHAAAEAAAITLPLYGRIAAGQPIEALREAHAEIAVPAALIGPGEHYALEVVGDSMIEAGIFDGDTAIIRKGDTAEGGQIVVALIDDGEVTLKRLRRRGNSIALEPANTRYETRIVPAERVKVQGRLVGLLRRY